MVLKKIIKYKIHLIHGLRLLIKHFPCLTGKKPSTDFRASNSFLRLSSTLVKAQSTFLDQTLLKICQG